LPMIPQNNGLKTGIAQCALDERDPAGRKYRIIGESDILRLTSLHACTPRRVHRTAMEMGIWPLRYARNRDCLSIADQLALLSSRVSVIGAGGLGGYVLQLLARIGIGILVTVDPDTFDETNLNRQTMARTDSIGEHKTDIVVNDLAGINPGVEVIAHPIRVTETNVDAILQGSHAAVDALDNPGDRLILEESCRRLGIPFVHGALTGFEGRVMTLFPDDPDTGILHKTDNTPGMEVSAETLMGTPAIAPAFIASLQAMEVIKIILKRGRPFRNRLLYADLEYGRFEEFRVE